MPAIVHRPKSPTVESAACDKCCDEYASARFVESNQKQTELTSLCRRPIYSVNIVHKSLMLHFRGIWPGTYSILQHSSFMANEFRMTENLIIFRNLSQNTSLLTKILYRQKHMWISKWKIRNVILRDYVWRSEIISTKPKHRINHSDPWKYPRRTFEHYIWHMRTYSCS